ncbi:sodium:proton antiporter [Platysternon megacephalum]|uniref:10 kDa heat shock protein, mitochondrial n=1 Tax=Platysternon megacephalum TaxID=55544 RepID=A0A4D9DD31_9SAUR|nr:sodium:proton antiporter [Platysternon megacephalum]
MNSMSGIRRDGSVAMSNDPAATVTMSRDTTILGASGEIGRGGGVLKAFIEAYDSDHGGATVTYVMGFDVTVTIKPLEDRILVQPLEAEQTTASGLVIPDTAKEKPQEGKVVATGPGRVDDNGQRVPLDIANGDVVIFSKYGGTEVKYDGQEYLLLNARDILAIVSK